MNGKILVTLGIGLLFGPIIGGANSENEPALQPKAEVQATADKSLTPPDIKPGVKIHFRADPGVGNAHKADGPGLNVLKVRGNWVYIEGPLRVDGYSQREGWVNFNQVTWYRLVKEK